MPCRFGVICERRAAPMCGSAYFWLGRRIPTMTFEDQRRLRGHGLVGCVSVLLLVAPGCGRSTAPTAPPAPAATLIGNATDPVGDALITPVIRDGVLVTPVVPVLPDLVAGLIENTGGNLTATVSFAPGSLSRADTTFCVLLDTDENPTTGNSGLGADSASIGWDYSICGVNPRGSTTAQVSRALGPNQPGQVLGVGSSIVTFPGTDQARITVPLSLLGNDDGRLSFKVLSMQWVDAPIINTAVLDWMLDVGQPPGLVR
jgi:hypothetical protein